MLAYSARAGDRRRVGLERDEQRRVDQLGHAHATQFVHDGHRVDRLAAFYEYSDGAEDVPVRRAVEVAACDSISTPAAAAASDKSIAPSSAASASRSCGGTDDVRSTARSDVVFSVVVTAPPRSCPRPRAW